MRRALPWLVLVAALLLHAAAERAPLGVENGYARGVYPLLSRALSCPSSQIPLPLAEPLALSLTLGTLAWTAVGLWRLIRRRARPLHTLAAAARRALTAAAFAYLLFLLLWGLNYRRQPFAASAALDTSPAPAAELMALSVELIEEANLRRADLLEDASGSARLQTDIHGALQRAQRGLALASDRYPWLRLACAAPKPALLSPLLARLGVSGLYVPFTGEALVNATLPAFDLPFAASHELAHLAGIAREDEANYVAVFACRSHPDPDFRYSGAYSASAYTLSALAGVDRPAAERLAERRSPGVRRDAAALAAWAARYAGPLQRAGERLNDAYLRSQGQAAGVRSYGRMVDLLIAERRSRGVSR